jgi:xylulose-5-phosphate/fructose-6-phosphate phosphoketolase
MRLQPEKEHPHGLSRRGVRRPVHGSDKPIIFAFHGYPWLIHR